ITTDGFLRPNAELEASGLMERKGFPESYDTAALVDFLHRVKSGEANVPAPVYSHLVYDIIEGEHTEVDQPDILIVEGLNVLQTRNGDGPKFDDMAGGPAFASDYFDFSIYVDADEAHIEQWYVDRFHALRAEVFQNPESFFRHFAGLTDAEADEVARSIWAGINAPNLRNNIAPTRDRADLILRKGADHQVTEIRLRK
ncbi:MAG: type I pantothenate kinase, partial [Acidimicrobiales bacterium]|nr:type I pantothenate kinase [Acidimicrobiales bacterium]